MFDFAKEMYFDEKAPGNKSTRDRTISGLFKSPGLMIPASGVPSSHKTSFLPYNLNEFCDNLKVVLQKKQAGNISQIISEEINAIADNLLG